MTSYSQLPMTPKLTLGKRMFQGLIWSFLQLGSQQGAAFVIGIFLARLLEPRQFGLIAMLTIFISVAQSIANSGFSQALIQKRDVTQVDKTTVFYFNCTVGIAVAALLCILAPWIAGFYKEPMLVPLVRVLSLSIVINALRIVQVAELSRQIDFKAQMKANVIATVVSGGIGIAMAYCGYGVWSLVTQSVGREFLFTGLLYLFYPWRPRWEFSLASLRSMLPFGSRLLFSGLLDTVFRNLYLLLIGRVFTAELLGFYHRAERIQRLPVNTTSQAATRVAFPIFSSVQADKLRLRNALRKSLTSMVWLMFPMMVGLAIVARPLVIILITDKWLPSVPYLQLLCVVGLFYPLSSINMTALKALGRSDIFLRLEVLKKLLVVIAIVVSYRWGVEALILGQIGVGVVGLWVTCRYTGRLLEYSFMQQVRDLLPILMATGLMAICVRIVGHIQFANCTVLLVLQVLAGVLVYSSFSYIFRLSAFVQVLELVQSGLGNRK